MRVLLIVILVIYVGNVCSQNWPITQVDSFSFSIKAPQLLAQDEKKILTELGEVLVTSFGYKPDKNEDPNLIYQVITYEIDSFEFAKAFSAKDVLQSVVNSTSESESAIQYQAFELEGAFPYVHWRMSITRDIYAKVKAYLKGNRVFIIQVMFPKEKSLNDSIDPFLESFQFID